MELLFKLHWFLSSHARDGEFYNTEMSTMLLCILLQYSCMIIYHI